MALVLALMAALVGRSQFLAAREQAEGLAHRSAHVLATHYYWVFEVCGQALRRINDAVDRTDTIGAAVIRDIHDSVRDLPAGFQYSVYDAHGNLAWSSVPDATAITVEDRPYFVQLREGATQVLSPQVVERLTGVPVFIIARRLENNGVFNGAATIAIPQASLHDMARALQLEEGSSVSLVADDGMMIARSPIADPVNLKGGVLFQELEKRPDGAYQAISPADGEERIVGYWRIPEWRVTALVGIATDAAFRNVRNTWTAAAALALPVLAVIAWLVSRLLAAVRDDEVTKAKLEDANERATFLLREIHHGIKNNLQTVMSLVRLHSLDSEVRSSLLSRIDAMVKVHEEMYRSDKFEFVELRPYLTRMVEGITKSHGGQVSVEVDIAPVELAGERALQLGMLTNEVVSNSFKHAFSEGRGGHLKVHLNEAEPGTLRLVVEDDGPGLSEQSDEKSMGKRLVAAFASQLGGTYTLESDKGTRFTLNFPKDYGVGAG